ncbi:carbohydrate kinase, partial [Candidatus Aerophobetes bacterium]|nr:carbohydrate kinase [Candidatus Aerophobetes bacterium]
GKNDFIFYRGAEMKLLPEEVNEDFVVKSKILHTGSISITCEPCYSAVLQAIHLAHKYEVFVSFDPNLRPSLWSSLREAKDKTIKCINGADLVKMNEEELRFFTGKEDLVKGARWLLQKGPKAVVITQGNKGSFFYNRETLCFIPGYKVKVADTLGCGDAFTAAIIYQILLLNKEGQNISFLSEEKIRKSVEFANAAGALAATGKGAIPSLPTAEQVKEFLSKRDVQVI